MLPVWVLPVCKSRIAPQCYIASQCGITSQCCVTVQFDETMQGGLRAIELRAIEWSDASAVNPTDSTEFSVGIGAPRLS